METGLPPYDLSVNYITVRSDLPHPIETRADSCRHSSIDYDDVTCPFKSETTRATDKRSSRKMDASEIPECREEENTPAFPASIRRPDCMPLNKCKERSTKHPAQPNGKSGHGIERKENETCEGKVCARHQDPCRGLLPSFLVNCI